MIFISFWYIFLNDKNKFYKIKIIRGKGKLQHFIFLNIFKIFANFNNLKTKFDLIHNGYPIKSNTFNKFNRLKK